MQYSVSAKIKDKSKNEENIGSQPMFIYIVSISILWEKLQWLRIHLLLLQLLLYRLQLLQLLLSLKLYRCRLCPRTWQRSLTEKKGIHWTVDLLCWTCRWNSFGTGHLLIYCAWKPMHIYKIQLQNYSCRIMALQHYNNIIYRLWDAFIPLSKWWFQLRTHP